MKLLKLKLLVLGLILFAAGSAFASYSYEVTVDTSSLTSGTNGYLYFNYAPLNGASSNAAVSNFTTNGTLGAQDIVDVMNGSAVSGTLPGTVTFGQATNSPNNDYNHAIAFGSSLSFLVSFSGAATSGTPGGGSSTFSLGLFSDAGGASPIFTSVGANNELFDINLLNGGNTSVTTFGGPLELAQTPIPPSVLLFGSGLIGLVGMRRRAKNLA